MIDLAEPAPQPKPAAQREDKKIENADDFVPAGNNLISHHLK